MNDMPLELRRLAIQGTSLITRGVRLPVSRSEQARQLWDAGEPQRAITMQWTIAKDDPGNGEHWLALGYFYLESSLPQFALTSFRTAAALLPLNPLVWGLQACALDLLGRDEDAERCHTKALAIESWRKEPEQN